MTRRRKWNVAAIKQEVIRLDPNLSGKEGEPIFQTAVILLAATRVGCRVVDIARFTGYGMKQVREIVLRCRQQGIITKGVLDVQWWHKTCGSVNFWLDVAIALGSLSRQKSRKL